MIAYDYFFLYVKILPPSSQEAQEAALTLIASALRLPTMFDFDPVFRLEAVLAVKNHELFELFQIFLSGTLLEFKRWESEHQETLEKYSKQIMDESR